MSRSVTDSEVAAYHSLCHDNAKRFKGVGGAEYDDLYQEGMIAVWGLLRRDLPVSNTAVKNRMRDWVRKCRRNGFSYEADGSV